MYKAGCSVCVLRSSKEELTWAIDKQFTISYYTIPLDNCKEGVS